MYRSASSGTLLLLLGDAKIRTDKDLAFDFGFASGSGSDDQKLIDEVDALRKEIAGMTSASAIPVLGSGSILNGSKWTPLVNDSFILGGVCGCGGIYSALTNTQM
jgi:roadblock/LC7 domain-containing protein